VRKNRCHTGDEEATMSVIEITTFRLTQAADEAAFLSADRVVQAELAPREGFLRRTTARGDDGVWLVLTLWRSARNADDSAQATFEDPATAAFTEIVDGATVKTQRYRTLD
jgi:hypothetical protein